MKKIFWTSLSILAMVLSVSLAKADEAVMAKTPSAVTASSATPVSGATHHTKKGKSVKKAKSKKSKASKSAEKQVWICPMCHIKADHPGKCPECGMDMVLMPKTEKSKKE